MNHDSHQKCQLKKSTCLNGILFYINGFSMASKALDNPNFQQEWE